MSQLLNIRASSRSNSPALHGLSLLLVGGLWAAAIFGGCTDRVAFPSELDGFTVRFVGQPALGSTEQPLDPVLDREKYISLSVDVEAIRDGQRDPAFNGWAVITIQPRGALFAKECLSRDDCHADPVAVRLTGGQIRDVKLEIEKAFGPVRLVVTDVGYLPPRDLSNSACKNNKDDDGDGYIDAPADRGGVIEDQTAVVGDRGCFTASDDSETGGSGAAGASPTITFHNPRISEIQRPIKGVTGEGSPLEKQFVTIDRGWVLVTQVNADGMYVTDFQGASWDGTAQQWSIDPQKIAYGGLFVFNYSTPVNLQVGDCLVQLNGTIEEFYGFTEMNKPTWKKGDFAYCAAKARQAGLLDCPTENKDADTVAGRLCHQRIEALANQPVVADFTQLLITEGEIPRSVWENTSNITMTEPFESARVQLNNVALFAEIARCDHDKDGRINYQDREGEGLCGNTCGDKLDCIVWENYQQYNQWSVNFTDGAGVQREVAVVASGVLQSFDPYQASLDAKQSGTPKTFTKLVGILRHFMYGRPPWILQMGRPDDCPDCINQSRK